jgi:hypothetical protein
MNENKTMNEKIAEFVRRKAASLPALFALGVRHYEQYATERERSADAVKDPSKVIVIDSLGGSTNA